MSCFENSYVASGSTVAKFGVDTGQPDTKGSSKSHDVHRRRVTVGKDTIDPDLLAELDGATAMARSGRPAPERLRSYFRLVGASRILAPMLAEVPCPGTIRRRLSSDLEGILTRGLKTRAFRVRDLDASVSFAFGVLRAISGDRFHAASTDSLGRLHGAMREPTSTFDDHVGMLLKAWGHPGSW